MVGLLASRSGPAVAANRRLSSLACHSNPLGATNPFAAVPGNHHPDFQPLSRRAFRLLPLCPLLRFLDGILDYSLFTPPTQPRDKLLAEMTCRSLVSAVRLLIKLLSADPTGSVWRSTH